MDQLLTGDEDAAQAVALVEKYVACLDAAWPREVAICVLRENLRTLMAKLIKLDAVATIGFLKIEVESFAKLVASDGKAPQPCPEAGEISAAGTATQIVPDKLPANVSRMRDYQRRSIEASNEKHSR